MKCDLVCQVNGRRLLGLNHVEVVTILKGLPQHVRIVCARRRQGSSPEFTYAPEPVFQPPVDLSGASSSPYIPEAGAASTLPISSTTPNIGSAYAAAHHSDRLVKSKSEQSLPLVAAPVESSLNRMKSRSLEPLTGLAMWSSEAVVIELTKGERGLGFSILDYQVSGLKFSFVLF